MPDKVTDNREIQRLSNAHWAHPEEVKAAPRLQWDNKKIFLGVLDDNLVGIDEHKHLTLVASSRGYKGVSVIVPNLLLYTGSVIVIDLKGELSNITAKRRGDGVRQGEGLGQKVCVLDPFGETNDRLQGYRKRFNPLDILNENNPYLIEDAGMIADSLVVQKSGVNVDPHWDESAKNFIIGVILFVVLSDKFAGRRNLYTVYDAIGRGMTATSTQLDEQGKPKERGGIWGLCENMMRDARAIEKSEKNKTVKVAAAVIDAAAKTMLERGERERGGVLSTINRHLTFLSFPAIKEVTETSDFDIADLKSDVRGMTIYLVLPATRLGTCARWLRLIISLCLEKMQRMGQEKPKSGAPVLFLLDEFAAMGYMPQIGDVAVGQIASFHVKFFFILQSLSQLKHLYQTNWETILSNCEALQFFSNGNDMTTLEYIEKRLGKTAVWTERRSENEKGEKTKNYSYELHDLITAPEAALWFSRTNQKRRQLVLWADYHPIVLERIEYYEKNGKLAKYLDGKFEAPV